MSYSTFGTLYGHNLNAIIGPRGKQGKKGIRAILEIQSSLILKPSRSKVVIIKRRISKPLLSIKVIKKVIGIFNN